MIKNVFNRNITKESELFILLNCNRKRILVLFPQVVYAFYYFADITEKSPLFDHSIYYIGMPPTNFSFAAGSPRFK